MKAIADTGFVVAFFSGRDRHHDWAIETEDEIGDTILTCEPVLTEAAYLRGDVRPVLGALHDQMLRLQFDLNAEREAVEKLARIYSDRQPDLADLCVIRMSELFPQHRVLTTDRRDFTVYRRNGREPIPVILPPE